MKTAKRIPLPRLLPHYRWFRSQGFEARSAITLARAEYRLRRLQVAERVRVVWEDDPEPDLSWMDQKQYRAVRDGSVEVLCCSLEVYSRKRRRWTHYTSLGGIDIHVDDLHYRRVVGAELACEL